MPPLAWWTSRPRGVRDESLNRAYRTRILSRPLLYAETSRDEEHLRGRGGGVPRPAHVCALTA